MRRFVVVAVAGIALFGAGAAALVAWLTRERPLATAPPPRRVAETELPLPEAPSAREQALESNAARLRFDGFRRSFAAGERSPRSEARLLPALDVVFAGGPRWTLECRGLVCRLEVAAPPESWRAALDENAVARREVEQTAFDPDGGGVAFVQLVEPRVAAGPARPEGERILAEIEQGLLASEAARGCVAGGPGAEVRLMIDGSGITYRFGTGVDASIATCLMMEAMPDVVGGVSAPAGVRRAQRKVLLTAR